LLNNENRYIKKRELEIFIGKIGDYICPKVHLEQYVSPPHLVSRLLWIAFLSFNDISGKKIIDLGAGTGRIGLSAAYMGADEVYLVEVDYHALRQAWEYAKKFKLDHIVNPICADVSCFCLRRKIDVALQNPPFGVHRRGADMLFLHKALELADTVYSIHKKEGLDFIIDRIKSICRGFEFLFEEIIVIPKIYDFHEKFRHRVNVVAIRVSCV